LAASLQRIVLREQAAEISAAMRGCRFCSEPLLVKGSTSVVYRTAFGKVSLATRRFYSRCPACGSWAALTRAFNPLAIALPERMHPQWVWLP
jgi:hypothetical protein